MRVDQTHVYERTYIVWNFRVLVPNLFASELPQPPASTKTVDDDNQKIFHPRNKSLMVTKAVKSIRMIHRDYSTQETRSKETGRIVLKSLNGTWLTDSSDNSDPCENLHTRRTISHFASLAFEEGNELELSGTY